MWWGMHEWSGWWMVFSGVWMVLFWGAVIALAIWGIRALGRGQQPPAAGEDPLEIARRRYARGEITRAELEEILDTLNQVPGRS
jgi:putative membrane protein